LRHYTSLGRMETRLHYLLETYAFTPMRMAL